MDVVREIYRKFIDAAEDGQIDSHGFKLLLEEARQKEFAQDTLSLYDPVIRPGELRLILVKLKEELSKRGKRKLELYLQDFVGILREETA